MATAVSKIVKDGANVLDTTGIVWVRKMDSTGKWYLCVVGSGSYQLEFPSLAARDSFFDKVAAAIGA